MSNFRAAALVIASLAAAVAQSPSKAIVVNPDSAAWVHEEGEPAGSEFVTIHSDAATGGMEILARFPAGHVIVAHSHDSNERIVVVEGQLTLRKDSGEAQIKAGGFAFLPAGEVQRLSCSSDTRCTFYLIWDGNPKSHPAK